MKKNRLHLLLIAPFLLLSQAAHAKTENILADKELLAHCSPNPKLDLSKDKYFIMDAVRDDGYLIRYADKSLKLDKDIALAALKGRGFAYEYMDPELLKDKFIALKAIRNSEVVLEHLDKTLLNNKEFALKAAAITPNIMWFVGEKLRDDKELVYKAVKRSGFAIRDASERLKNDKQLAILVLQDNIDYFQYIGERLKQDKDILSFMTLKKNIALEAIKKDCKNIAYLESTQLRKDKNIKPLQLKCLKKHMTKESTPPKSKQSQDANNRPIETREAQKKQLANITTKEAAIKAVNKVAYNFIHLPKIWQKNKEVVLATISSDGRMIKNIDTKFQHDPDILRLAVKSNGAALLYAIPCAKITKHISSL